MRCFQSAWRILRCQQLQTWRHHYDPYLKSLASTTRRLVRYVSSSHEPEIDRTSMYFRSAHQSVLLPVCAVDHER